MNYRLKKVQLLQDYEVMLVNLARRQKVSIEYLQSHNMHNDIYNAITFHSKNLGTYALIRARLRTRVNTLLKELSYE